MLLTNRLLRRSLFLLILVLPCHSSTQEIPGELSDNQWELTASRFQCRLNNYIPGIGEITLFSGAGAAEKLSLNPDPYEQYAREIDVILDQPPWRHDTQRYFAGSATLDKNQPLDIRVNVPYMVEHMQKGLQLTLDIKRPLVDSVSLKIPALNFKQTARDFYACFSELLVLNFEQAEETIVYYNSSRHRLKSENKKHFRNIAEYVLADESVERVEIDAHTDGRGSDLANRELSKKRGEAIANRLKQFGVPESKIIARFHGERYPIASNETAEGRNKNRRVKIKLIRR